MLNEQFKAIGHLARDIATAALRPDASKDLGVIASELAVLQGVLLPPLGDPQAFQHAVTLARIMVDTLRQSEADIHRLYEDVDDARFPARNDAFPSRVPRRRARRGGRERVLRLRNEAQISGEGADAVQVACVTFDNGVEVVGIMATASSHGSGPTCLLSPEAAREAAAALLIAADALDPPVRPRLPSRRRCRSQTNTGGQHVGSV